MTQLDDLYLGYVGGCGGFFALHLLLISNQYNCSLEQPFDQILKSQWSIKNAAHWKHTEVWPNNIKTLEEFDSPRLFFECNPVVSSWKNITTSKVLIYTDLFLQLSLSKYKNANFYGPDMPPRLKILDYHFTEFYNNIRDPNWPDCTAIEQVQQLPNKIIQELQQHEDFIDLTNTDSWEQWFLIKQKNYQINNQVVYKDCFDLAQYSNYVVDLKDIVRSQGAALLAPLGLPVTEQHIKFINMWVNLHSPELIRYLNSSQS